MFGQRQVLPASFKQLEIEVYNGTFTTDLETETRRTYYNLTCRMNFHVSVANTDFAASRVWHF